MVDTICTVHTLTGYYTGLLRIWQDIFVSVRSYIEYSEEEPLTGGQGASALCCCYNVLIQHEKKNLFHLQIVMGQRTKNQWKQTDPSA